MRFRRTAATIALASILVAACGEGDTGSSAEPAENGSDALVADADTEPAPAAETATDEANDSVDNAAPPPADEPDPDEPPTDTSEPATEPEPDEAVPEPDEAVPEPDEAVPSMAWPDDGCSADNSPTPTDLADAPAPVLELRVESADGPLPDVAVRRLNCNGGWVNFRNEIPSELPLLVWFWAPH